MKKESIFVFAILLALFFVTNNHLHSSFGDLVFEFFGISPWSKENHNGVHLPVVLGIILLIIGIIGTVKYYSPRHPKIRSRIFIFCVAFILLYPVATEKALFLLRHNSSGIRSIDILTEESRCSIRTVDDTVRANCSLTIFNYGNEEQLTIRPILLDASPDIVFEERTVSIIPHTKIGVGTELDGFQRKAADVQGNINRLGYEIEIDGKSKIFE
ncbi:hypothetical protein [Cohnella cellulosilytica]|uniref:Uncharacterized protein n=1 Tax=Cohnella cellulosilytica TaxID=986710 RepID=A0ABW2FL70_9BACL